MIHNATQTQSQFSKKGRHNLLVQCRADSEIGKLNELSIKVVNNQCQDYSIILAFIASFSP